MSINLEQNKVEMFKLVFNNNLMIKNNKFYTHTMLQTWIIRIQYCSKYNIIPFMKDATHEKLLFVYFVGAYS